MPPHYDFDAHANFPYSTVAIAPSPATSGLTVRLHAGDGDKMPATPFHATIWAADSCEVSPTWQPI